MAYNATKENKTRLERKQRLERRKQKAEKLEKIRAILLKSKREGLPSSNIDGYALDEKDEIVKLC